jgi:HAD superfamily hydrolase (TIGR01509 family)
MPAPSGRQPVLLLDIMDTIVKDPFFTHMPAYFGLSFKEVRFAVGQLFPLRPPSVGAHPSPSKLAPTQLLESKHPTAWVEFERDEITEQQLFAKFFKDGSPFDGAGLVAHMVAQYRYIEGMEALLGELAAAGVEVHACSNYPSWWRHIEAKLGLAALGLRWTFVSCEGPMRGLRKPAAECFAAVVDHMGLPPAELIFVDDRQANVDGAAAAGLQAVRFQGAAQLRAELQRRGVPLL